MGNKTNRTHPVEEEQVRKESRKTVKRRSRKQRKVGGDEDGSIALLHQCYQCIRLLNVLEEILED